VVGESVLGEVVGANFFGAVTRADHGFTLGGFGFGFFALLFVEEFGAEHFHGGGAVFVLGAFVLTLDDYAGGNVGDADGGVGGVDVLAAGSGGAIGVDSEVFGFDFDVYFFGFG